MCRFLCCEAVWRKLLKKESLLAKHSYEPDLNGAGRELLVRKDGYAAQAWNGSNLNGYANSDIDTFFNETYISVLSSFVQNLIGTTKFRYTPGYRDWSLSTLERAVFALSLTELGGSNSNANVEGSTLPIASQLTIAYRNGSPDEQWTRSPYTDEYISAAAWFLDAAGNVRNSNCYEKYSARPCFTLPNTALVDADLNLIET